MYQLINKILLKFLPEFKRTKTWRWFVVMIIGFIIRSNHNGVTSTISSLRLKPELYHCALHFYRSKGYEAIDLYKKWTETAIDESNVQYVGGRVLLLGDHIKISKEGRRMPNVQIHHQESQNSGKSEFIEGHIYGHVCAVITDGAVSRSLPLQTNLHKVPPRDGKTKKPLSETIIEQMMDSVQRTATNIGKPVVGTLDAYFCKGSTFICAEKTKNENGEKLVEVIVRASSDTVAFTAPAPRRKGQRGRTRIYGDKIKLYSQFDDMSDFTETTLMLYGKPTKVRYKVVDLLWKPIKQTIRFVAIDSEMGKMVLMSSNLSVAAEEIITAYAARYKIEVGFNDLKNAMGGFSYRFWAKAQPKRKKWAKNAQEGQQHYTDDKILNAKAATETFVCLSTIAAGILTVVAFSHKDEIWKRYPGWLRTRRSYIPTISITKETISQDFHAVLEHSSRFMGFNFIRQLRRHDTFLYHDSDVYGA